MAGNMVGRVFNNRYEITERVGIGGMAEVYRAKDNVLGRIVAVKVMLPQYAADETFTKRFRLEAASAARLQNSRIVTIYDWGCDDDTYYIVMEFLRGTDLKTAIQERGIINQRKVAEIGSQVAEALATAHAAGIIHRDIKPQNIMIQPDGNIKVMDFGIARAGDAGLSQTSTVLGTAHYVSPEQAQGKDLGPASDIYSLGIVMYEAATGRLPFEGTDAVSVAVKQVNELPVPPRQLNPNLDPTLEAIIMKALEKDPANRFNDASAMRHALNDFLAGRPVNLGGVNSMPTTVMGASAGAATTVMPRSAAEGGTTRMNAQNVEMPEKKDNRAKIIGIVVAVIAVIAIGFAVFNFTTANNKIAVPDVSGKTLEVAKSELQSAGFQIGTVTESYNVSIASGSVISTDPTSGSKADSGSKVNIVVSKGSEAVDVPDLLGMSSDQAKSALTAVGLNYSEGDTVYSDDYAEGKVAAQSSKSGSRANKGDTITVNLSKGSEKTTIPDVSNLTQSSATKKLEDAGFSVSVTTASSSSVEKGNVISYSPTGTAKKGSTVTIKVSSGASSVTVPNVKGMTQSEATSELENSGFKVSVTTQSSTTVEKGNVISYSPSGTATSGSTVTITVSSGSGNSSN